VQFLIAIQHDQQIQRQALHVDHQTHHNNSFGEWVYTSECWLRNGIES
jgi:hypothetical protein